MPLPREGHFQQVYQRLVYELFCQFCKVFAFIAKPCSCGLFYVKDARIVTFLIDFPFSILLLSLSFVEMPHILVVSVVSIRFSGRLI